MSRLPVRTIIETWKACDQNVSETARRLHVDRRTVKRWVDFRAAALGLRALAGRAAQVYCTQTPQACAGGEAAAQVRRWREATGFCREKLAVLAQAQGLEVSASTIHRYLQRVGLVRPSTKRRRPRFQNGQVMRPRNCPGLARIHRGRVSGQCPEAANGRSSESGIMVL